MFDPRYKSFCLVFSFIGCDQRVTIVEQYDIMSLYLMVMKCIIPYIHLRTPNLLKRLKCESKMKTLEEWEVGACFLVRNILGVEGCVGASG
jgi:hypothetical protein